MNEWELTGMNIGSSTVRYSNTPSLRSAEVEDDDENEMHDGEGPKKYSPPYPLDTKGCCSPQNNPKKSSWLYCLRFQAISNDLFVEVY